jgi:peptidylprolyl isomerase
MRGVALVVGAVLAAGPAWGEEMAQPAPARPKPVHASAPKPKPAIPPAIVVKIAPLPAPAPPPAHAIGPRFSEWRSPDADNTLVIDTDRGRVVVELRPEFAPLAVERMERLARSQVYDGLLFHRVVDGFAAQTGAPDNLDGGKSQEPDLPAEFTFRLGADAPRAVAARPQGETEGFIGAQPYASVDERRMAASPDGRVSAWGAFCAGVVGMTRDADPDSANSGFFILRDTARSLDRRYAPVGRVLAGLEVIRSLPLGDPPPQPARMLRVRVLADLPEAERPQLYVLDTRLPQFAGLVQEVRQAKAADFSLCDVEAPVKVVSMGTAADAVPPATPRRLAAANSRRSRAETADR